MTDQQTSSASERPTAGTLDVDFVRAQFPAFSQPDLRDWVHFENAGGSYVPSQVIDLLTHFYTATKVQPYGPAGPARAAGEAMDRARALVPATLNAAPDEVQFGPSTSQNTYVLARALRATMDDGDEVIVTNQDHEANIGSWRRLADTGVTVREWSVNSDTGLLDLGDLSALLTERTRLVCVTHASNLAATINPIRAIADLVHKNGGLVLVDGVSWAPHAAIDVAELDCDFYLYSTYKTYGPHQGLIYTRRSVLERLTNQGHFFKADTPTAWLSPAGPDHAAVAASAGMIDYYEALYDHHFGATTGGAGATSAGDGDRPDLVARIAAVYDLVADHEERLMAPLLAFLQEREVRLIGSPVASRDVRAPTIAFTTDRAEPTQVVEALAADGIGGGRGDFYAVRLCSALGLPNGVVRLSMVHYNTEEEVDRTIGSLAKIL
ncbi:MAG: aminotransferase class V-fold PLP-dependent enzyme [Actinomycetota bacterium]